MWAAVGCGGVGGGEGGTRSPRPPCPKNRGEWPPTPLRPVLANVLLEATKQGLRLSGTDLDIAVGTTVAADVDAEGAVTLPAKKLSDIVRELPSAPIRVTTAGGESARPRGGGGARARP